MCTRCAFLTGVTASALAAAAPPVIAARRHGTPDALEIAMPGMRRISDTLWLGRLSPRVWIHTTTHVLDGVGYYPANGAIVTNGDASLLIDTGWNDADASAILDAWHRLGEPPIAHALATHFHADRVGGVAALATRGIPTYGNPLTIGLAEAAGHAPPLPLRDLDKRKQQIGGVEVFYPGAGHTVDNIVAYVPSDRVLFGGCLVKSTTASDLGYLEDARIHAWPATMGAIARSYAPRHVIPGHGTIAGDALAHTSSLAIAANRERR